jgi:hypothetical protein
MIAKTQHTAGEKQLDSDLEKLLKDLSVRHTKKLLDLKKSQERQIHGDPPHWLEKRHLQERQDQKTQFAEEHDRYIREYQGSRHLRYKIRAVIAKAGAA